MQLSQDAHKVMSNAEEYAEGGMINMYHILLGLDLYSIESGQESNLTAGEKLRLISLAKQHDETGPITHEG